VRKRKTSTASAVDAGAFDDAAIMELCPPAYVGEEAYRNKGDRMRKLLEEMANVLKENMNCVEPYKTPRLELLLARITAALAEPEPDAMDKELGLIISEIRGQTIHWVNVVGGSTYTMWRLSVSEAAALIADFGKRVPRAMLDELMNQAVKIREREWTNTMRSDMELVKEAQNTIAAKYDEIIEG